ncbi:MAG TPA: cyclic nucleotide-binding domain-containing protein [Stellaceae bacterium]|nr:cyclic nucleotide-binding domain-containing protein [Stellaceae bacterium]
MERTFPLIIVGSGPGGIAAAAQAANVGIPFVLLERSQRFADTIGNFAKGKLVMSTPKRLPLHRDLPLSFEEGPVEEILATWNRELRATGVFGHLRLGAEVTAIAREGGVFRVGLADGEVIEGEKVVLALGTQGNICKLDVPGAERVQYQLADPSAYQDRDIVVVGSGDTAIENALALADRNRVTMVVRGRAFKPEKVAVANLSAIESAMRMGLVRCRYNAATARVDEDRITLRIGDDAEEELDCDVVIARIGSVKPRKFLESCGVTFEVDSENADPAIDARYCSAVDGLYVIGALAGYPLIKHCLNQGYEVVEHIRGAPVEPADVPVLEEAFAAIAGRGGVEQVLQRVAATVPLFAGLSRLALGDVLLDGRIVDASAGEMVIRRGEYGDSIFAILDGLAAVEVNPDDHSQNRILRAGDFFGEMGLISGRPRSATVRAATACTLIEVPRRAALKLITAVPAARNTLDEAMIVRQIRAYVSEDLAGDDLEELVSAARPVTFLFGETIIEAGAPGADVHLIQSGSATISCRSWDQDVVVRFVPAGHMVGDHLHVEGHPNHFTATAAAKTAALRIDGAAFARVLKRNPALAARIADRVRRDLSDNAATAEKSRRSGALFDDFLHEGVGEAVNVLVIDESICTRCDNCERACAETHGGISRLDREAGPTYATLHVPTSCRHCENPQCMLDCPADAIHRSRNGEVFIDDSCIGCGACERNCPYGVIRLAAEPAKKPGLLMWLLFGWGSGPGEDYSDDGLARHTGHKHAVKCDMCQGIGGGPACVSACPTGAAMRVSPSEFLRITQQVRV